MPETFWAWLAGFIDGDGHLGIYPAGATLEIVNVDTETLKWIHDTLGFGYYSPLQTNGGRQRQPWKWGCYGNGLRVVLPRIIPYLRVKHERAVLLLEYVERFKHPGKKRTEEELAVRQELKERIAVLNKRSYAGLA